ncbi:MAG: glycosyltransferase [Thermoplasmatales archaeon]
MTRVALFVDQPHWTGIGIYAIHLKKLLETSLEDVKLYYVGAVVDNDENFVRPSYLKYSHFFLQRPLTIASNYKHIFKNEDLTSYKIHFLGADYIGVKLVGGIVTVHDLIRDKIKIRDCLRPKRLLVSLERNRKLRLTKKLLPLADKIIAISKKTSSDILNTCHLDSIVIRHWADMLPKFDIKSSVLQSVKLKSNEKYILNVSDQKPVKRLDLITKFCNLLPDGWKLIKIGSPINSANCINLRRLDDYNDYLYVFKNSSAYLHLSDNEGFGIPLLESMELLVPVICRSNEINKEILDDCAIYISDNFNAQNVTEIVTNLSNESISDIRLKIEERSKLFDPKLALQSYLQVYGGHH